MKKLFTWIEIPVVNFERAVKFYTDILGIQFSIKDEGDEKKAQFPDGEGILFYKEGFTPSADGIVVNIDVGDQLDKTLKLIAENGGKITRDKTPVESSEDTYFALFIDSEGNRLGLNGR